MPRSRQATNVSDNECMRILAHLCKFATKGVLERDAIKAAAELFQRSCSKIKDLWRTNGAAPRSKHAGRPTEYTAEVMKAKLKATAKEHCTTVHDVAGATGISKSTVQRKLKAKEGIRRVTVDCSDSIHVDEKWFYVNKVNKTYYLATDEEDPHTTVTNKLHMAKVMFLVAIARAKYDHRNQVIFYGKIGLWPVIEVRKAVRNSKNQAAGTDIIVPLELNAERYKTLIISKLLPAIKAKWIGSKQVTVQHDNATSHNSAVLPEIVKAGMQDSWRISFRKQPPKSPDLNVLDLGFFHSLQTIQHKTPCISCADLISVVESAFVDMDALTIDKVFPTLQAVQEQIMLARGSNNDKLPRFHKDKVLRETGNLPRSLRCDADAFETAIRALSYENIV